MNIHSVSREKMIELAEEIGITITFDNPPEKVGIFIDGERMTFEEVLTPIFNGRYKEEDL